MQTFYSHGKLLLTGEYAVLDGATALALPTRQGQGMTVEEIPEPVIQWKSIDNAGNVWFEESFDIATLKATSNKGKAFGDEVSKMLFLTLFLAEKRNPIMLPGDSGFKVTTTTEFPRDWGLGTSSTLIANIAKWFQIDAFELLRETFGGSGYDVAVALQATAITFQKQGPENAILKTSFTPPFLDQLFFVHLNQKQNSRDSIAHYRRQDKKSLETAVDKISALTHRIITCTELLEFELLLEVHENVISQLIGLQKVRSSLFSDYSGAVKSLGGWGGDFVLATGSSVDMEYFRRKGFETIVPYREMILD